jgi:hypothetical protein
MSKTKKQQGLQLPADLELRAVFAAAAMAGWQACPNTNATTAAAVKYCYEVADAMLAERERGRQ